MMIIITPSIPPNYKLSFNLRIKYLFDSPAHQVQPFFFHILVLRCHDRKFIISLLSPSLSLCLPADCSTSIQSLSILLKSAVSIFILFSPTIFFSPPPPLLLSPTTRTSDISTLPLSPTLSFLLLPHFHFSAAPLFFLHLCLVNSCRFNALFISYTSSLVTITYKNAGG